MTDTEWEEEIKQLCQANQEYEMENERLEQLVQSGNAIIADLQQEIEELKARNKRLSNIIKSTAKEMKKESDLFELFVEELGGSEK